MNSARQSIPRRLALALGGSACGFAALCANAADLSVSNLDLSGHEPALAAAVPVVAVDPSKPGHIAVAWRFIDPLGGSNAATSGNWVCHVSISDDNGQTFVDHALDWHAPSTPRCNAPWVGFSGRGTLYLAATLTGMPPTHAVTGAAPAPSPPGPPEHPKGAVGFMSSSDDGQTWSAALQVIPSDATERFMTDDSIPMTAKEVPWDGARGAVDLRTGAVYLSGAFPARPGGSDRSQRFYSVSLDKGKTFGVIRAFGDSAWPERWDGDIAAAEGEFIVSYIGNSTSGKGTDCPCAVIGMSSNGGRSLHHRVVAMASDFDLDTLVHYPEVAADPIHRHRFALALIAAQKNQITVLLTADDGQTWQRLQPTQPSGVAQVTRPSVAFSPQGALIAAWRGSHADGSYDIYCAAAEKTTLGPVVKVSTQASTTPPPWRNTYAVRGDFHTSIAVDRIAAHVAWADARTGADIRAMYARVPLIALAP